jgi:hypothetical protein
MDILGKLFGSPARVKVMRLVLANPSGISLADLEKRSRLSRPVLRKELNLLKSVGFLKTKGKAILPKFDFEYFPPLREMLVAFPEKKELAKKLCRFGKVKLLLIGGNLLDAPSSGADLLLVGDKLKRRAIEKAVGDLEGGLGRSIAFAIMDTPEFLYRYGMYDKFVRNILDFPHEKLVCAPDLVVKLGLEDNPAI